MDKTALLIICFLSFGLVKAPNYDFELSSLEKHLPGNTYVPLAGDRPLKDGGVKRLIKYREFHFPIYLQIRNKKIIDLFAKLPNFFLHDVYHRSLIKKLGIQDKYQQKENSAHYRWDKQQLVHHYEAECTITCFPIYYSVTDKKFTMQSFLKKMRD